MQKNNIQTIEEAQACKELFDVNNGRVLCFKCHKDTPTYGFKAKNYVLTSQDTIPIISSDTKINPD